MADQNIALRRLPAIDALLKHSAANELIETYGRAALTACLREIVTTSRTRLTNNTNDTIATTPMSILAQAKTRLAATDKAALRAVFNLTGTVLHTNLGRALLPEIALEALTAVAREPTNLEYDLDNGRRGQRDTSVTALIRQLTGAAAATVVNNNAAAVLLVLNTLARRKEVLVSRGELVEIGGSFRIPEVMSRAGTKLHEVGTTNRTHLSDYADAINARTGMLMKIHTSNYAINGFTAAVTERELATLARSHKLPLAVDLGSGTLVDLERYGLAHEPTVTETLAQNVDLVTFSGDKLLGGPQAGIIAGDIEMIKRLNRNPLKRALRVDKLTLAALEAVLKLYRDPDRLAQRLPTLRLLSRSLMNIANKAQALAPILEARLGKAWEVNIIDCASQIGSGALPVATLPSCGLAIRAAKVRGRGRAIEKLANAFRGLPKPVIGRIENDSLIFDLRCLEDDEDFLTQLPALNADNKQIG